MTVGGGERPIGLMLFRNDAKEVRRDLRAGIDSFVVDWEVIGKPERQQGWDTDIRPGTEADLVACTGIEGAEVWCRINGPGPQTSIEVERAIAAGADGIFLPMVRTPAEVELFLRLVAGRSRTAILVETVDALRGARDLASLPFDRVYFGLNDFAISRGSSSIFEALFDGSVDRAREIFRDRDFGFGGLTAVALGSPVRCRFLVEEMARLDCGFTFLRRSFLRDTSESDRVEVVRGIRDYWKACRVRDREAVERDHRELEKCLLGVVGPGRSSE